MNEPTKHQTFREKYEILGVCECDPLMFFFFYTNRNQK